MHIDGDELLHGSLSVLDELPDEVVCVRMRNAEAVHDDPDAQEHEGCYAAVRFRPCGDGHPPCRAYDNRLGISPIFLSSSLSLPPSSSSFGAWRENSRPSESPVPGCAKE
jgi:hypothetical protein